MIQVRLFGRFAAGSKKCQMTLRDGSKAQELFAYLLLNAQRPHTREAVASLLWDQCTTEVSKAYLRKALWQLRSALDKCEMMSPPFLQLDAEWIQVHAKQAVWSDVMVFEQAYEGICAVEGAALGDGPAEALQEAVELYGAGLLPNRYDSWCLVEQERYRRMYLIMREQLIDYHMTRMHYHKAIEQGAHILRCDSSHERTHQRMMWLHYLRQDRTSALSQYRVCTAALEDELGVEPSQETTDLYNRICDGTASEFLLEGQAMVAMVRPLADSLSDFQARLHELQSSFIDLKKCTESLVMDFEK